MVAVTGLVAKKAGATKLPTIRDVRNNGEIFNVVLLVRVYINPWV